jgi:antitoxin VapB
MTLRIRNPEVEKLAGEVAEMAGETEVEAIRRALEERLKRLSLQRQRQKSGRDFLRFLEEEVWPKAPPGELGRRHSCEEEAEALGYGPPARSEPL